jgi:hypothetical protein
VRDERNGAVARRSPLALGGMMDQVLKIAAERALELEDLGVESDASPATVRRACDRIARELVAQYESGAIDWEKADRVANNFHLLMVNHCGGRVPDYAWDVFLAFDESEIDGRRDPYVRARIIDVQRKYGDA